MPPGAVGCVGAPGAAPGQPGLAGAGADGLLVPMVLALPETSSPMASDSCHRNERRLYCFHFLDNKNIAVMIYRSQIERLRCQSVGIGKECIEINYFYSPKNP